MFFTKADGLHGIWFHTYSLTLIFALVAFPSLYHGIDRNPLANADMDLITVYQASLILAGQPLDFNPHTGYLLYLAVAGWFTVVDWIGFYQISDIHGLLNSSGYDEQLKELISAARWFSVVLACLLSALIYYGVILLSGKRMVALILVILLVLGGGGVAAQSIQIRTELISMLFVVAAGLLLMLIPRLSYVKALGALGLCGFFIQFHFI